MNTINENYNLKKEFARYVSLNMLSMIGFAFYILVDTYFIAEAVGTFGLAALNFSIPALAFSQSFILMISMGSGTLFAVNKSRGGNEKNVYFTHGLILGLIVALIFAVVGLLFSVEISILLGSSGEAVPLTNIYVVMILGFAPFFFLNNLLMTFIRNDDNPRLPMIAMIVSCLGNILGDYVFLFIFDMGMFGAVLSTCISPFVSMAFLLTHIVKKKNTFHIVKCKIQYKKFIEICKVGLSAFAGELATAVSIATFNLLIMNISGNIGVAAYSIITNFAFVMNYLYTGLAQGIQPLVSSLYGQFKMELVNKTKHYAIATATAISIIAYVIVLFFTDEIIQIFNAEDNALLAEIAKLGTLIFFIGYFFAGINYVSASILSASLKAKRGMLIAVLRCSVVLVPVAIICASIFGLIGVWSSFVITEFLVFVLSLLFLKQAAKENQLEIQSK